MSSNENFRNENKNVESCGISQRFCLTKHSFLITDRKSVIDKQKQT